MQLYPYVLATGDLAEWDALSATTCEFCSNTRAEVERLQAAGQRSVGGVTVLSATGQDLGANGWYRATLSVAITPSEDIDKAGVVVDTNDGGTYTIDVAMTWSDGWTIDSAGIVETPVE
ncbi:hypothetical protein KKR89_16470 [Cellulomonas dongxiuzhuiae]|uniref:Lipoprotein n=2 Tax=Cellulomonas dongxiuzhuiae TaxID=2819979 RepID=A0ABX8GIU9_9CELL|nr:hypothetical protein KKR89_16470 [Cellulomonas dongxiuzhuiae]